MTTLRRRELRDVVLAVVGQHPCGVGVGQITSEVRDLLREHVPEPSISSCLRSNTPELFTVLGHGHYTSARHSPPAKAEQTYHDYRRSVHGKATLILAECIQWLKEQPEASLHAVVTDPPYGLVEYSTKDQTKLRAGSGGNWRLPPSFDGSKRSPLPRFTVLSSSELEALADFFSTWAAALTPALVPGANVVVATNPLFSYIVAGALGGAGLERRGELVRLVSTMRGGDRPKGAHEEFPSVSVMPRSMWEPWMIFRRPLEGRVQDNLRRWGTGGFRRPSGKRPFGDVIPSAPTRKDERALAPHPSLKPQAFLRRLVRGVLPLGRGIVVDPFCGAGSTLAAANSVGYRSIGIEKEVRYFELADKAIPKLSCYRPSAGGVARG